MPPVTPDPWRLPFSGGGPRPGGAFRDRRELVPEFREPQPGPESVQAPVTMRAAAADKRLKGAWDWIARPSIGLAMVLVLLAARPTSTGRSTVSPLLPAIAIVILCVPGLA
jgi:hypothetical protein